MVGLMLNVRAWRTFPQILLNLLTAFHCGLYVDYPQVRKEFSLYQLSGANLPLINSLLLLPLLLCLLLR